MAENRYFKCNVIGGFRLSDLNMNVKQDETIPLDSHIVETSRAVAAAIRSKWLVEVSDEESDRVSIKSKPSNDAISKNGVAIHDASETNEKLESRQARRGRKKSESERASSTVGLPDFKKVSANLKSKQDDTIGKTDKTLESPVRKAEKTVELSKEDEDEDFQILKAAIEGTDEDETVEDETVELTTEDSEEGDEPLDEELVTTVVKDEIKAEVSKRAMFKRKNKETE